MNVLSVFEDEETISAVNKDKLTVTVKLKDGSEKDFSIFTFCTRFTYKDMLNYYVKAQLSEGTYGYCEKIYEAVNNCQLESMEQIVSDFRIDYRGYGFPQFTEHKLDKNRFGSRNADEYIYKALPSSRGKTITDKVIPHFWEGKIPKEILQNKNIYFVVRIRTRFYIKPQYEPFIRYKEIDLLRGLNMEKNDDNCQTAHCGRW